MNSLKLAELTTLVAAGLILSRFLGVEVGLTEEELVKLLWILLPWLGIEVTEARVRDFLHKRFPSVVAKYPRGTDVVELRATLDTTKSNRKTKR